MAAGRGFYPPGNLVFNALQLTPLDEVRVVILGQDPVPRPRAGDGVLLLGAGRRDAAAVAPQHLHGARDATSPCRSRANGDLTAWATRGVLLLNSVLTVAPGSPASHAGKGWEQFTDRVIAELSARREGIVFLLWGRYAQQKGAVVDTSRHHVLTAAHPSPYSAANGFFGCRHFSRANGFLEADGREPVDWRLPHS